MALFPISSDKVQFDTGTPAASDQFSNGVRLKSDNTAVYGVTSGGQQYQNGLLLDANGAIIYVDASAGLPANTQYTNGLPFNSSGALCVSTNAVDEWINGIPFDSNGAVCAVIPGDPNYNSVSLLLHFDGADGSTTFTDNSPTPKTPTVNGNAQIDTAVFKFGGASGLFDGTGDYLQYAQNAAFDFGSGDYTIELQYKPNVTNTTQVFLAYTKTTVAVNADVAFVFSYNGATTQKVQFVVYTQAGGTVVVASTNNLPTSDFTEIALSRVGTAYYLFMNGVLENTVFESGLINAPTGRVLRVGSYHDGTPFPLNGWIDELRITKGVGRYTTGYTPQTSAFPNSL